MHAEAHAGGRELGGRAVEHHALLQHDHVVEVVGDRAELVRDEQHRAPWWCSHQVDERVAEQRLRLHVDAGDRLVEHQQLGLGRERLGDERALLLATGQLVRAACRRCSVSATDSSAWSTASRSAARAAPPPALLGQPPGRHHLLDGGREVGRDARPLRHVPHPPAVAEVGRGDAEQLDRAGLRARAARAGSAAASTSPSRSGPASAANSPARTARPTSSSTTLGAVGERHVGRPRATRPAPISGVEHDSHYGRSAPTAATTGGENGGGAPTTAPRRTPATTTATPCGAPRPRTWAGSGSPSALTAVFVVVEAVTAFVAGSLALLSDAAHMLTDAVAIALALGAIVVANRASQDGVPHLRAVPARDPRVARERDPAVRGRRLRADRSGGPPHRGRQRRRGGPDARGRDRSGSAVNLSCSSCCAPARRTASRCDGAYVDAMADAAGSVGVIVAAVVIATDGLGSDRPHRRHGDRRVDPAARVAARRERDPRAAPGRARARRPRRDPRRAAGAPGRRRRARPPRVDAHVGDGRRQRARDGRPRRRRARRARPGARRSCSSTRSRTPPSRWSPTTTKGAKSSTGDGRLVTAAAGRACRRGAAVARRWSTAGAAARPPTASPRPARA